MSLLTPSWHKLAGFAKWITCRTVAKEEARRRLEICKRCPTAQVRRALGWYWLSCGEPGEDFTKAPVPSCGCGLGIVPKRHTKAVDAVQDRDERRRVALTLLVPKAKSRCRGAKCDQGKWG